MSAADDFRSAFRYLSALRGYLETTLASQPPYFPLSFEPRSEYARQL